MREHSLVFQAESVLAILAGHQVTSRRPFDPSSEHANACSQANPGDLIHIRELWRPHIDAAAGPCIQFSADMSILVPACLSARRWCTSRANGKWWPASRQPAWGLRQALYLLSIEMQRLDQMTALDAIDEGVPPAIGRDPLTVYASAWRSIYGPTSWSPDRLVRVVRFARITPA